MINATPTITVSSANLTLGGIITGSFGLTKAGSGTLVLSGNNTYTGNTRITGGTLSTNSIAVSSGHSGIGNNSSAVTIENNGILSYTGGDTSFTRGFTIDSGVGEVDNVGAGTLTIGSNNVATSASTTFVVGGTGNVTVSSSITGGGAVTMNGSGILTLSSADSYGGTTTLNAGTMEVGNVSALSTGELVINGGIFNTNNQDVTINGGIDVKGGIFTGTSGSVITSNVTLNSGTLTAPNSSGIFNVSGNWSTAITGTFNNNSGTVNLNGSNQSISGSNTFDNLTDTVTTGETLTFAAGKTQVVTGTLTLTGASGSKIILRSSASPSRWSINPAHTTISNVDVEDSTNLGSTIVNNNSKDSGNNINWYLVNHFVVTGSPTMTAGNSNQLTITAVDGTGGTALSYNNSNAMTFSGPGNSPAPSNTIPTVTNDSAAPVNFGSATNITFSNGVSSIGGAMVLYDAQSTTVNVTDGTANSTGHGLLITVNPAGLDHFIWANVPAQSAGANFTALITAQDIYDNTKPLSSSESVTFTTNAITAPAGNAPTYNGLTLSGAGVSTTANFSTGSFTTPNIVLYNASQTPTITITDSTKTGTSNTITVNPGVLDHFTWSNIAAQTAGSGFTTSITARDLYGNLKPLTSSETVTFTTTATNALAGNPPYIQQSNINRSGRYSNSRFFIRQLYDPKHRSL